MNRARYRGLDAARREAVDAASGAALAARFGGWWDAWSAPAREAVRARGNTITALSASERQRWASAARPATDAWLASLDAEGVPDARAVHDAAMAAAAERERDG